MKKRGFVFLFFILGMITFSIANISKNNINVEAYKDPSIGDHKSIDIDCPVKGDDCVVLDTIYI